MSPNLNHVQTKESRPESVEPWIKTGIILSVDKPKDFIYSDATYILYDMIHLNYMI